MPDGIPLPGLPISAVERDTGIGKDTLRVWERRYGFPRPYRDRCGERLYSRQQIEQLRLIKRLLDQGLRPGKIVGLPPEDLMQLLEPGPAVAPPCADAKALIELLDLTRSEQLRGHLALCLARQGLQRFITDTLPALNVAVGEAWARGEIGVHEEHLYSEAVQNVLRAAIGSVLGGEKPPRVLLTTFPGEEHRLGLLMAEALLTSEDACCVSLGAQTPLPDIRNAVLSGRFDLVGLSFSRAYPSRQAVEGLVELRRLLPHEIEIWVGGHGAPALAKLPPGVRIIGAVGEVLGALQAWRVERRAGQ